MWERYKGKKAGVHSFDIGDHYIRIRFNPDKSDIYTYNYYKPGMMEVEKMKELAVSHAGLSSYISREIRDNYYSKD
jgi:hypothetical protein